MKHLLIPLCVGWMLMLASCKKEAEPQLPPETQVGANTFGCLVNGEVWIPSGDDGFYPNLIAVLGGTFSIGNYKIVGYDANGEPILQRIPINMKGLTKTGVYPLEKGKIILEYGDDRFNCVYSELIPDSYYTGQIEIIRFDVANRIISGRFEATLKVPNCDTIKITQGRFDVKSF